MPNSLPDLRSFISIANDARDSLWVSLIVDTKVRLTELISSPHRLSLLQQITQNLAQITLLADPMNMEVALDAEIAPLSL